MMTFDKIYGESAPSQPVVEELPPKSQGEPVFVLHESGIGSRVLGQGSTYNEMYADAAKKLGMPEGEVRQAGYKFSVEHKEILSSSTQHTTGEAETVLGLSESGTRGGRPETTDLIASDQRPPAAQNLLPAAPVLAEASPATITGETTVRETGEARGSIESSESLTGDSRGGGQTPSDRNRVEMLPDGKSIQPIIDSALHPMTDSPDPQSDPESAAAFELLEKRRAQMARAREVRAAKHAARKEGKV